MLTNGLVRSVVSHMYYNNYIHTPLRTDRWGASPVVETDILEAKTPTNNVEETSNSETENTPTADAVGDKSLTKQQERKQIMKMFTKKINSKTLGSPQRLLIKRCV